MWEQEIIEFPAVLLDAPTLRPIAQFREFVRPSWNPQLSRYCTELTGIQQSDVDGADYLPQVLQRFGDRLDEYVGPDDSAARALPVTCGNYDLGRMLWSEASQKGLKYHRTLWWWCNVKVPFAQKFGKRVDLLPMLEQLGLDLIGRHHSGIHDTWNVVRIVQVLVRQHNACIEATSGIHNFLDLESLACVRGPTHRSPRGPTRRSRSPRGGAGSEGRVSEEDLRAWQAGSRYLQVLRPNRQPHALRHQLRHPALPTELSERLVSIGM